MKIEVRECKFDSPEYHQALALRYRVLREPLGLQFGPDDRVKDSKDTHLLAFIDKIVVGTLTLAHVSNVEVKMRQVAIDETKQGLGIGGKLVQASEGFARGKGYKTMQLNARESAVSFYEKLGYLAEPETFNEVGIPHKKMHKRL